MSTETQPVSGGQLCIDALTRWGVDRIFTLSGGHVFPIYDGCVKRDVSIIDVRHEQTATFAAEGWAKLTRGPGVAVLTAGPGVTNGVSAVTTARFNGSPLVVLGGRAPAARWGAGSLQEFDHVPVMEPITVRAATVTSTAGIPADIDATLLAATSPHRGPAFLDLPMDLQFHHEPPADLGPASPAAPIAPDAEALSSIAKLVTAASRPVLVAGSDVWFDGAWEAMQVFVEAAQVPVFANGMGRGTLPADHALAFSRARSTAFKGADLVLVAGTPLDFRLGFGSFGDAQVVHLVDHPDGVAGHVDLAGSAGGSLSAAFAHLGEHARAASAGERGAWVAALRDDEKARRAAELPRLQSGATPIAPPRIYGELLKVLDRDAVVIGDGGDFVSYAGKFVDSYLPGRWMDPGPYGCLGTGLGYAIAARLAHPDAQVVLMLGDGALGFSAMDFDTLVRFGLPIVAICGNNGIWGLEKHPMKALYGYDVAADLQAGCRYDQVVSALGGHGELVTDPDQIAPAIRRAFDAGAPALVNIVTDPTDMYPRSSNLA